MSTRTTDFVGTPSQADQASIPRRFVFTTRAGTTVGSTAYWREEVLSGGGAGGSSHSTVFPGAGTTFNVGQGSPSSANPWFVQNDSAHGLFLSSLSTVSALLTTASRVQVEGQTSALVSTASTLSVIPGATFPVSVTTASTISALLTTASKTRAEIDALTTASVSRVAPQGGAEFTVKSRYTPNRKFTNELGTTYHSTFAGKVSSVAGTTVLMTSAAGAVVRVLSVFAQQTDTASTAPQRIQFLTSATTIAGAPELLFGQREGVALTAPTGAYLFQTSTGEALQINLSTNVQTVVHVTAVRTT